MNILSSGNVTSLTLGIGGSGYVTAPTVTIAAPPSGGIQATAVAVLSGNAVSSFIITNAGSGYNSVPTVTIAAPPSGTTATATAVITANDYVDQYNTFDQWRVKTNRIVDGVIDAQTRGIVVAGRSVTSVQIVNGGTGYTSPTIAFSAPPTSIYLDVNSSNTLAGTVVTNTTGTIKQIVISGSTKSSGSLFTYGSISSGDIVIQGSTKGRIIQKMNHQF